MPNKAKIRKLIRFLRANPRKYNQDRWLCRTSACLAGETILMEGFVGDYNYTDSFFITFCRKPDSEKLFSIHEKAQDILGLACALARKLFSGNAINWPKAARDTYQCARDSKGRVEAAVLALEALLEEGE